ncbi:4-hydroxy-tetrahydrodipicolinate synthase [Halobacterium jilantaiense]|uniref:4-hydroxy-tetrahydrodipicolinate synthase n=1 Tax=Halobacterium jilantaiense TaxID=355548 RepID=A0A1I0NTA3_9EURY|nr:4-hydroxy-tetrahydrodipicolinate synthase [Halobacterium jilantaiense]SEW04698.1 4-hydroxy-tetrahydrodipicolinate synthase [Halobacterium jilantaiense]
MTYTPLDGVFPAMTTPFTDDGRIDFDRLRTHARRLVDRGVDGVVPVGTTGESATLTHDEHVEVVAAVADEVGGEVPVVAGAGSNSTHEAVGLAGRSVDAGADALLLISPYYNRPEPEGIEAHYREIADRIDAPQVVYNVPSRTGRNVDVDTVASLASHDRIVGYKAASGDVARVSEVVERTRDEAFSVLSGDDALTLPVCSVGGRGAISVTANVEPERVSEVVWSAIDGDYERAREVHHDLAPLHRALFLESNPIPVKAAQEIRGHGPANYRSPLSQLGDEPREALEAALSALSEPEVSA